MIKLLALHKGDQTGRQRRLVINIYHIPNFIFASFQDDMIHLKCVSMNTYLI